MDERKWPGRCIQISSEHQTHEEQAALEYKRVVITTNSGLHQITEKGEEAGSFIFSSPAAGAEKTHLVANPNWADNTVDASFLVPAIPGGSVWRASSH
ncbi:unnamed protein product [Sphagnum jensenii]